MQVTSLSRKVPDYSTRMRIISLMVKCHTLTPSTLTLVPNDLDKHSQALQYFTKDSTKK